MGHSERRPGGLARSARSGLLHHADVMWVEDARPDVRFKGDPFVFGGPYIRFYAGAPIDLGERGRIGTVCVMALEPRSFNPVPGALGLAQRAAHHVQPAFEVWP